MCKCACFRIRRSNSACPQTCWTHVHQEMCQGVKLSKNNGNPSKHERWTSDGMRWNFKFHLHRWNPLVGALGLQLHRWNAVDHRNVSQKRPPMGSIDGVGIGMGLRGTRWRHRWTSVGLRWNSLKPVGTLLDMSGNRRFNILDKFTIQN